MAEGKDRHLEDENPLYESHLAKTENELKDQHAATLKNRKATLKAREAAATATLKHYDAVAGFDVHADKTDSVLKDRDAAARATLKHYDEVAGFDHSAGQSLHFYTSDDSFDDQSADAAKFAEDRGALEKVVLNRLESKMEKEQSALDERSTVPG